MDQQEISILIADIQSGKVLCLKDPRKILFSPGDTGSLVKIFLAYDLFIMDAGSETFACQAWKRETHPCWHPGGHGLQDLSNALANSCNAYFNQSIQVHRLLTPTLRTLANLGVNPCRKIYRGKDLIGGHGREDFIPVELFWAAAALLNGGKLFRAGSLESSDFNMSHVFIQSQAASETARALKKCWQSGTLGQSLKYKGSESALLSKTGTGLTRDRNGALTMRGWYIGYWPEKIPRYGVLCSCEGIRGSQTGIRALELLKKEGWIH